MTHRRPASRACARLAATITLALAVGLGGVPRLAYAQTQPSVEDWLGPTFPSVLTGSPEGGAAWVEYDEGRRNVILVAPPAWERVQLTRFERDDGQVISDIVFMPGRDYLLFVRGGPRNRHGQLPNPRARVQPPSRAIWRATLDGSGARRLTRGHAPAVSHDGRWLAFLRGDQLRLKRLDAPDAPERRVHVRGAPGSLRWSPAGSRLAFVVAREGHSTVATYRVGDESVRYLDPGFARDQHIAWSPDGNSVAFVRLPVPPKDVIPWAPRTRGRPWSLRVAEVASGEGREVWRADEGPGSLFNPTAGRALVWTAAGRLVFPWEKDGWNHLYALDPEGGNVAGLITPGDGMVEEITVGPKRESVYFTSNRGDPERRHVWRIPAGGNEPEALTKGRGIEWSPVALAGDEAHAHLASGARTPAHVVVVPSGREPIRFGADMPDVFPREKLVEPRPVALRAKDGLEVRGQLFLPRSSEHDQPYAAVVHLHGAPDVRQMLLGWHYRHSYYNHYSFHQLLASRGIATLSLNYRGGLGYGLSFREPAGTGPAGASELQDVLAAAKHLRGLEVIDGDRIGIWGNSYGGYLTALALSRASDTFAAGVDLAGAHNWNVILDFYKSDYDSLLYPEVGREAFQASPMASVDSWESPVLLIQGDDDRDVPFVEGIRLHEALTRRGVEIETLVLPDELHDFRRHASWVEAFRAALAFFEERL